MQIFRIISSREVFLGDKPFESLEAAEEYAHGAFSSANYLVLECLNGNGEDNNNNSNNNNNKISGHARHAANHLGKAQGLATMLRAAPYNAAR